MNKKFSSLPVLFSVNDEISNEDTRFIKVTIDVLHTGLNFNTSIFNKEVVDECIDSIKNTAILGFIRELPNNEKDFKGHEYILTKDDNGIKRKYIGSAYGLIPESCNPRWINKLCDDGIKREFLQVDGLIWTKFEDSSNIILNDIVKPQSMELNPDSIEGYENEDGNFVFTKFSFDGCCILGDNVEPAMINSTVEVQFSMSDFVRNVQEELNDKFTAFTKLVNKDTNKGGSDMPDNKDFALSVKQQLENIATIVREKETYRDRWGDERSRYSLVDIQDNEVIIMDRLKHYNYYGFPYVVNGDEPVIDFACGGKRKKIAYTDYEDGVENQDTVYNFENEINTVEDKAFSKIEDTNTKLAEAEENYTNIKNEYESVKNELDEIKPKYEKYVEDENARIKEELNEQKEAEFSKVEYALSENEEFIELKNNKENLTLEEISTKCAILYTKISLENNKSNFNKSKSQSAIGVIDDDDDKEGYVSTKYGNIPVRR